MSTTVTNDRALELIRFGWTIAELRGRVRLGKSSDPARLFDVAPTRTGHALPLSQERSAAELLIETKQTIRRLAGSVQLELSGSQMKDANGSLPSTDPTACDRIIQLSDSVPDSPSNGSWKPSWNAFTEAVYQWDAQIQDALSPGPYGESSAYQLGRGLSEMSWSLDPSAPPTQMNSWEYLFGAERCISLTDLLNRLTPVAITAPVSQTIKGTLATWQRFVQTPSNRSRDGLLLYLRQQVALWRDLLLSGADPASIVQPATRVNRVSAIGPVLRALRPQILLAGLSTAVLGAAGWLLTTTHATGPTGAIVAALGIFGVTASSASAKAKSAANELIGSVRSALTADLLVIDATWLPPSIEAGHPSMIVTRNPGEASAPITIDSIAPSLGSGTTQNKASVVNGAKV